MKSIGRGWLIVAMLALAAPAAAQSASATLTGITCPGAGCLSTEIAQIGQIAVQIEPGVQGTYVFEQKNPDATDWLPWELLPAGGRSRVSFTREPGLFMGETTGVGEYRIRISQHFSGSALVIYNFLPAGTANFTARYIIAQDSPDLINAQNIGALATGLLKNTNSGGATPVGTLSRAVPGVDYVLPNGDGTGLIGIGLLANPLSQFAQTTFAQLASIITEGRTGTGAMVGSSSPTITTPTLTNPTIGKIANLTQNGVVTTKNGDGTLEVVTAVGVWGTITGSIADQTDLAAALSGKQPLDGDLTAIAAISTTAYGRALLALADAVAARTAIGVVIGTDVQAHDSDLDAIAALATTSFGRGLLAETNAASMRTTLGLVIGVNVQAPSTTLAGYGITDGASLSLANLFTGNGTLGTPGQRFSGSWPTGGTGTTTVPYFYISPAGATQPTTWRTTGTGFGLNMLDGVNADAMWIGKGGAARMRMTIDNNVETSFIFTDASANELSRLTAGKSSATSTFEGGWCSLQSNFGNRTRFIAGCALDTGTGGAYGLYTPNATLSRVAIGSISNLAIGNSPVLLPLQHTQSGVAGGNCASSKAMDFGLTNNSTAGGDWYEYTITGSCTLTTSNITARSVYTVYLTIDGTGGYAQPTLPGWTWAGGAAPTFSMGANKKNLIVLYCASTTDASCFAIGYPG